MKKKIIICLLLAITCSTTLFGCTSKSTKNEDIQTSTEINKGSTDNNSTSNSSTGSNSSDNNSTDKQNINSAKNYSEEVHKKMLEHYNKLYAKGMEISKPWNDGEYDQFEERDSRYSTYKEFMFTNLEREDAVWENYALAECGVDAHGFDDDKSKVKMIQFRANYAFKEGIDIANSPIKDLLELALPNNEFDYNSISSSVQAVPNINKGLPEGQSQPYSLSGYNNPKYYCEINAIHSPSGGYGVGVSIQIKPEYFQ